MARKGKGGRRVGYVDRVMSAEQLNRFREYPEYHLIVLHRTGNIVYRECFMGPDAVVRSTMLSLQDKIANAMREFEETRGPRPLRSPRKPPAEIE